MGINLTDEDNEKLAEINTALRAMSFISGLHDGLRAAGVEVPFCNEKVIINLLKEVAAEIGHATAE